MDILQLIRDLRRPIAYPHGAANLEVHQTHISVVFLAGPYAYKVKKPVDLGFLDFTTLERRLRFCVEEVRLNRRLAPDVYIGVVPVAALDGGLVFEAEGPPVEYAVKMKRLPIDARLLERLGRGELGEAVLAELGQRIADFHAQADSGPGNHRYACWEVVARNARENLEQSQGHVGACLSEAVFGRLTARLEERLSELRPLIESRARAHVARDTHGDLHLEHVYFFPDQPPPRNLVVIDCIEFNERFRYADPVADMAFLVMDLLFHGHRDLAECFSDAYFHAAEDATGRRLLPFYVAYRAAVRGKVNGMVSGEVEVPASQREAAVRRARAHWLIALSELEDPDGRPCVILVGGLPGTGKSSLADALARRSGFQVVSSDRVRKELAGLPPEAAAAVPFEEGIYSPEWNDRTYAACLGRAGRLVFQGKRVIVDASFREESRRRTFLEAAHGWGVRSALLLCTAAPETVRHRIVTREGGASDADWSVYQASAQAWEVGETGANRGSLGEVPTGGSREEALESALELLRERGLAN